MNNRLLYLVLNGLLIAAPVCTQAVTPILAGQVGDAQKARDAQKALQHSVASKTAKFASVSKTDEIYAGALDAHDLAGAYKKVGQSGAFKGTVSKIFEERDGDLMILDFDPDYRTALTAVLKNPEFPHFPDMKALEGKEIVVSGSFVDYRGKAEIVLTDPDQIKIVR
jgi:hypothetical protein